ncbi:hypothetical protein Vretimale_2657 [Volvox reticuliferus]|uniref:DUF4215 domain-containing protein n=1 Tax=Volvox reticuliferus TaxID=1737510 RepID=A0A8J4G471_9CHLO|nr:hypothetical protein Vretimale_2657 [Volvox reticuliferus]
MPTYVHKGRATCIIRWQLALCCFCLRFFLCLQALHLRTANADGFICIVADDADRKGICQGLDCGGLYPSMIRAAMEPKPAGDATGILVLGEFDDESPARRSLEGWVSAAGLSTSIITYVSDPAAVNSVNFSAYKLIYLPSSANGLLDFAGNSGFTNRLNDALTAVRDRLLQFLNAQGGSLIALLHQPLERPYRFLPVPLTAALIKAPWNHYYSDVNVTSEMASYCRTCNQTTLKRSPTNPYHAVFTGPVGWAGMQVLSFKLGSCPRPSGPHQNCEAFVLCSKRAKLTSSENCYDGVDNDADGAIDKADPECWRCGDGVVDPGEECDDGNIQPGDGCTEGCQFPLPPSLPSPPPLSSSVSWDLPPLPMRLRPALTHQPQARWAPYKLDDTSEHELWKRRNLLNPAILLRFNASWERIGCKLSICLSRPAM